MKLSVIIPVYNEERDIEKCLKSLDSQNYDNFEVVIVDDGSNDKTCEVIKLFNPHNYKLQLLSQNHLGPATARNKGASVSTGDILIFVDSDMTFSKNFLKELSKPIRLNKAIGTYSDDEIVGNWENVWARCWNIQEGIKDKKRHKTSQQYFYQRIYSFVAFIASEKSFSYRKFMDKQNEPKTMIYRAIRKKDFIKVGGYDVGGYTDDYTLGKKVGKVAINAPAARFYHNNPDTLGNVFKQARWAAKRDYRFGILGSIFTIIKSLLPFSLVIGFVKAFQYGEFRFIFFKIVYDIAVIIGIIEYKIKKKNTK
jgi:glycosyltransferase involved in cell wall biosynthesis